MARAKFTTENTFKKITCDEVVDYLEKHGTAEEKKQFKSACFSNKNGEAVEKLNWLNGKLWFLGEFAPDMLPEKKEVAEPKSTRIANW